MNFWRFRNIQFFAATISVSRRRPVLAFVTERHDLGSIREAMATAIAPTISVSRRRPVLAFVTERHDLGSIREAMATAIARATFFSHSFRVWNWLLKLVSAESRFIIAQKQMLCFQDLLILICNVLATVGGVLSDPSSDQSWNLDDSEGKANSRSILGGRQNDDRRIFIIAQKQMLCFQDLLILICNVLATVGGVLSDPSSDQSWNLDDSEGKANSRSILGGRQNDDRRMFQIF
uniref:Uncharacterized protein n=1 Tax=Ascaris lumbricoides TaxID=6252 RepID=A0A0M3IF84_ASCLU